MIKKLFIHGGISMVISMALSQIVVLIVNCILASRGIYGAVVVPDFGAHFPSEAIAMGVQNLCIGLIGFTFGAASIIFEMEKLGYLAQGIIHFIVTAAVWVPISIFCWGLGKYLTTFVSVFISFLISYGITWFLRYISCKNSVSDINKKLEELRENRDDLNS